MNASLLILNTHHSHLKPSLYPVDFESETSSEIIYFAKISRVFLLSHDKENSFAYTFIINF